MLRTKRTVLPLWSILALGFAMSACNAVDTANITFCKFVPFLCKNADYQPEQPIFFSHKIHAGDNQLACQYCHSGARRSDSAVIPSVQRCMGCHTFINAVSPDVVQYQPEIDKLREYATKGESIPWVKAHDTQDHVRFSHEPHIQTGLECQTCHGPVQEFTTGKRLGWDANLDQAPLGMGWCIQCHVESTPRVATKQLKALGYGESDADWATKFEHQQEVVLGNLKNCYTCHK